jgi:hypothetical protein
MYVVVNMSTKKSGAGVGFTADLKYVTRKNYASSDASAPQIAQEKRRSISKVQKVTLKCQIMEERRPATSLPPHPRLHQPMSTPRHTGALDARSGKFSFFLFLFIH